jgi:hypothetical protein
MHKAEVISRSTAINDPLQAVAILIPILEIYKTEKAAILFLDFDTRNNSTSS